ncbi:1,6-anhydro-N-acetylmuramyl-L-alanine amidase AmpD [Vibrio methylphosphonaticus]|uniref:1,6-anhydro-N-acetylmuramyl-L-alanine amidase AmpD n=1 Tax=Vibrio methylphosphonaticus TaxID=2946866 RepID=UPI002029E2D1|nr:1,6-anhydro-N-acetylmuramyl-L-alanine amidase AmpD [Vibrio methylphosphonaticus]MCL9775030.1 1,6-anhydro-N-acetylmuramyl-L-alanine amidase AmpD [Vibrio methylphosphonaticus]
MQNTNTTRREAATFTVDEQGWYLPARRVPSPHFDARSDEQDISLLVVHNISLPPGQFGGDHIESFFQGTLDASLHPFFKVIENVRVSAHCLIRRDGEVVQFVPFSARAWHAGVSSFAGRDKCNDYSIGIELEGTDFLPYSQEQYQSLAELTTAILSQYPQITPERITGHQYIAPLRKTDPGLVFDWTRFKQSL